MPTHPHFYFLPLNLPITSSLLAQPLLENPNILLLAFPQEVAHASHVDKNYKIHQNGFLYTDLSEGLKGVYCSFVKLQYIPTNPLFVTK